MRQVVLDTETTGLDPQSGHRIIEIGGVELFNRRLTGKRFHHYINPEREIDPGAFSVHGISRDFLKDKPLFADIQAEFLAFVQGADLIIHNAAFDVGFINYEFNLLSAELRRIEEYCQIIDTLLIARKLHPGQKNNLDALCKRYNIDNSHRELHGALLDAEILAFVYLAMTGGQDSLFNNDDFFTKQHSIAEKQLPPFKKVAREPLKILRATPQELDAHYQRLAGIDKSAENGCMWLQLENP